MLPKPQGRGCALQGSSPPGPPPPPASPTPPPPRSSSRPCLRYFFRPPEAPRAHRVPVLEAFKLGLHKVGRRGGSWG